MTMDRHSEDNSSAITTADDLLAKMRAGVKEVYEIRLRDLVIPVRLISVDEVNQIRREAKRNATLLKGGDETDGNLEIQKCTLKLASNIARGVPILSDKLLSMLTVDEITHLYNEYVNVMDAVNPSLQSIDPEVFRSLVDALKKNTISAKDCSLVQLRAICSAFADLIQRLEIQNSQ